MGVDLGAVRVGVAISDPMKVTAQPHSVIERDDELVAKLTSLARENDVELIVVGHPLGTDGREGTAARSARREAELISNASGISTLLWDERFTSVTADKALIESGVSRAGRKEVVDKVAATVMLQSYLDAHRSDLDSHHRAEPDD